MSSKLSLDTLDGMEKMQEEVINAITGTTNSVHEIWVEIYGIEESLNPARVDDLKNKILNFCDALQEQAENQKNTLIKRVEDVLKEIIELEQLLDVEGHSMKDYKNIDVPLVEMDGQLWSILSKYRAEKDQRLEKLKTLRQRQEEMCTFLNLPVPPLNLVHGSIPTPAELETLEDEVYKLEVQKRNMVDEFYESRKAVASLIKELDVIPVLKCEMAAVKENDAMFPPSRKNLEEMKIAQQNLMMKLKNVKMEAEDLRTKLKEMWARCKWDANDLNKILIRHNGHSKVDISQLKAELKICEEERRTRVKEFVMDLREEIMGYWNMCYFSEKDKKKFKTFYTNDFNEDVLIIHELELENLKKHYEKYRKIYKLTEKWKEFWDRLKSIEQATKDPNRLFRNRGGQLLQEEKERKTIQKELPKIEEELQEHISQYEQETGSPFCMNGYNVRDLIKTEWDNWQANKDSLKQARKIANAHILEVESKLGARTMIGTKRKMPPPSRQYHDHVVNQPRSQPRRGKCLTSGRHEGEPSKSPTPATSTPFVSFIHSSPNQASYMSFEQLLEKNDNKKALCQNSLKPPAPDRILRTRNMPNIVERTPNKPSRIPTTKTPSKTPIRTPMKTPIIKTPSKSPFRIATGSKIPPYIEPVKSPSTRAVALKLTPARGKLPIII